MDVIPLMMMNDSANKSLLISRHLLRAHNVLHHIIGTSSLSFAQQLLFGWVVIGEACLDRIDTPISIDVI